MTITPGDDQQPGYQGDPPAGWYGGPSLDRPPDHPKATTALVLGIIALLGGITCYLPLFLGPWAWAFGHRTVKEIDAQPGRYDGREKAFAGYILGVVATVLLILSLVALIALIGFLVVAESNGPTPLEGESF